MPQTGYQNTKYYTRIPLIGRKNVQHVGSASDTVRRRMPAETREFSSRWEERPAHDSATKTTQHRRRNGRLQAAPLRMATTSRWVGRRLDQTIDDLLSCPGRIQLAPTGLTTAVSRCLLRLETGRRNHVGSTGGSNDAHTPSPPELQTRRIAQAGRQRLPVPLATENRSAPTAATMVNTIVTQKLRNIAT